MTRLTTPHAVLLAAGAAALTLTTAATAAEPVVLPTLGGANCVAEDINDRGDIAGSSQNARGDTEATVWTNGVPVGLGIQAPYNHTTATAINEIGEAVGYGEIGATPGALSNPTSALIWGAQGYFDIGAASGLTHSKAFGVNEDPMVVLGADLIGFPGRTTGYRWSPFAGLLSGGIDPIYRSGALFGINAAGDSAGYASAGFDGQQAILAREDPKGGYTGTEIGPQAVRAPSTAYAVSDSGIVVGQSSDDVDHFVEAAVFTLDKFQPVQWLGKLRRFDDSTALDVNDAGLIVGDSFAYPTQSKPERLHAVVWIAGRIYDLNNEIKPNGEWDVLISATGVNNNNDIVGYGRLKDGSIRGFLFENFAPKRGGFGGANPHRDPVGFDGPALEDPDPTS